MRWFTRKRRPLTPPRHALRELAETYDTAKQLYLLKLVKIDESALTPVDKKQATLSADGKYRSVMEALNQS